MNFYALNVAPLAGWETHLGVGSAGLSASASGTGRSNILLSGKAALSAVAAGGGKAAKIGAGIAVQAIQAIGAAYARMSLAGAAAAALAAYGNGLASHRMPGSASIATQAAGIGVVSPFAKVEAIIQFSADDVSANSLAATGRGLANMQLLGKYGIPNNTWHPMLTKNKRTRSMLVAPDNRKLSVPPDTDTKLRKREQLRVARNRRS